MKEQKEPKEKKGKGTITPKNSPKNSPRKLCITVSPKDCGGNNEGNNEDMIDIKEEFNNITMANTHSTQSQCAIISEGNSPKITLMKKSIKKVITPLAPSRSQRKEEIIRNNDRNNDSEDQNSIENNDKFEKISVNRDRDTISSLHGLKSFSNSNSNSNTHSHSNIHTNSNSSYAHITTSNSSWSRSISSGTLDSVISVEGHTKLTLSNENFRSLRGGRNGNNLHGNGLNENDTRHCWVGSTSNMNVSAGSMNVSTGSMNISTGNMSTCSLISASGGILSNQTIDEVSKLDWIVQSIVLITRSKVFIIYHSQLQDSYLSLLMRASFF